MEIADLLTHLEKVQKGDGGYMARCPAHDDRNPSLSVKEGEDRLLVHCHAGCSIEDVMGAIGLSMEALFKDTFNGPPRTRKPKAESIQIDPAVVEAMHQALTDKTRDYLMRERFVTEASIDHYHIGIQEANGERRITIPILNDGVVVCDARRWLSPPEARKENENVSKILHWSKGYGAARLFPIDQLEREELVLCEGELDALALVSNEIPALTATCGASTWPDRLSKAF